MSNKVVPATIIKGINGQSSNESYHANKTHFSSSQIKTLYWDHEKFEKEYIRGEKAEMKQSAALTIGTLIHTRILEEHLYKDSVIVSDEFHRRGNAWKEFVEANEASGKHLISGAENMQIEKMYEAYLKRPEAVELIKRSRTEVTIGSEIMGIPVKMRADALDETGPVNICGDVKSSGYSVELDIFKQNAHSQMLSYDISAAFYSLIAEQELGKPCDSYYIAISKADFQCHIYKSSQVSLINGRNKIFKALEKLNYFRQNGKWPDSGSKKKETGSYIIKEI